MMKKWFLIDGVTVITVGTLFFIGVMVVALVFPNWLSSVPVANAPTLILPTVPPIVTGSPVRMIAVAVQPTPRVNGNGGMNLRSLPTTPQVKFQGVVQQITEQPQSDGQLHIWIKASNGQERQVSVAPGWFLQYLGCLLQHDLIVSGSGFIFQQNTGNDLVYARKITINGKTCQLRNDEGFALWSNKLR